MTPLGSLDLVSIGRLYRTGQLSVHDLAEAVAERAVACADPSVWIHRVDPRAVRERVTEIERRGAAGVKLPLYGIPFAVKDSMDVAGLPTTAGCPAFTYTATRTAPAVTRLLDAGALLVGKTNLDQFGCGLAGDRSPYGFCRNLFDPEYIAGGSSSGSAVAVAAGLVSFALGTDTAGSGRVPAGCNNVVGLKPPPGWVPTEAVVPSCPSLDCVSVFALTVDDAWRVAGIAAGAREHDPAPVQLAGLRFAVPRPEQLDFFGDDGQAALFDRSLRRIQQLGGRTVPVDFAPFLEVGSLLYEGPWLAERLEAVGAFVRDRPQDVHPVTREVIGGGARYSGVDVFAGFRRLEALRSACMPTFDLADVLAVPTLPALPTRSQVLSDSRGWSKRLGRHTNFANLLCLAAVAVPAGFTDRGLPGGITFLMPAGAERRLARLGMLWQRHLDLPLGATGHRLPRGDDETCSGPPDGHVRLAVAGAHLRGQPLHRELLACGASFVRRCRTAPRYRFLAFTELQPPRPGLTQDPDRPGAVEVEVYDLPTAGFGKLVASVGPPLAIGTIRLDDGEQVKGFLCEPRSGLRSVDITGHGGWRAYLNQKNAPTPQPR